MWSQCKSPGPADETVSDAERDGKQISLSVAAQVNRGMCSPVCLRGRDDRFRCIGEEIITPVSTDSLGGGGETQRCKWAYNLISLTPGKIVLRPPVAFVLFISACSFFLKCWVSLLMFVHLLGVLHRLLFSQITQQCLRRKTIVRSVIQSLSLSVQLNHACWIYLFYSCSLSIYILIIWTKGNILPGQTFINPPLALESLQKPQDTAQAPEESKR